MIRIKNVKIYENLSKQELFENVTKKFKISQTDIINWEISKKSIDARDKSNVHFVYTFDFKVNNENKYKKFEKIKEYEFPKISVNRKSTKRPIIVGFGPAGIFAGLTLVDLGIKPIILEQGKDIESRTKDVEEFIENRVISPNSNIQFGEGGAGTFSDGKLNTGNSSIFSRKVLEDFVRFGAPEEILYNSKPHIGTDNLRIVIKNIREYIISKGGEIFFNEKVTDFKFENNKIKSVICSKEIETDCVILAIGHSARDTIKRLYELNLNIEPKNFAVGVRIEHLQEMINESQYGKETKLKLPSADYKLVYHTKNGRVVYTFCMCPGGTVMASASEEGTIVTNGMSYFARDGENANSALLVNVDVSDYEERGVLGGIYFQEELEKKAFDLAGRNYNAPVQMVKDFLNNTIDSNIGRVNPTYKPGITFCNLNELFPDFIKDSLKEALVELDKKLKGFAKDDSILTAPETRTSSAIRIVRNQDNLQSNIKGIYPCGEGAGYAGGIMTSAIDGIKCAIKICEEE